MSFSFLPPVTCIMPTYHRCSPGNIFMLEEAIGSFTKQDYQGKKELLILNDNPKIKIICDEPGVKVFNWHRRFNSLGAKYNFLVGMSTGLIIFPWEDDDISLSHRIRQGVEKINGFGYFNPQSLWYWEKGTQPRRDHGGVCHMASCYFKEAWLRTSGYPAISGGQDGLFDKVLKHMTNSAPPLFYDEVPSYIYRWLWNDKETQLGGENLSGFDNPEAHYREIGNREITESVYTIKGQWREDYDKKIAQLQHSAAPLPDEEGFVPTSVYAPIVVNTTE